MYNKHTIQDIKGMRLNDEEVKTLKHQPFYNEMSSQTAYFDYRDSWRECFKIYFVFGFIIIASYTIYTRRIYTFIYMIVENSYYGFVLCCVYIKFVYFVYSRVDVFVCLFILKMKMNTREYDATISL